MVDAVDLVRINFSSLSKVDQSSVVDLLELLAKRRGLTLEQSLTKLIDFSRMFDGDSEEDIHDEAYARPSTGVKFIRNKK